VSKRPDIVNRLPDGNTEEIYSRAHPRRDGSRSVIRKIRNANGDTIEVWHTVVDRDGTVLHGPHLEYQAPKDAP
jgi:hypothetical protein